jgi:hypothetical protein
VLFLH